MHSIFLDTNILIDILTGRKPHVDLSTEIFHLPKTRFFISILSIYDLSYVLRESKKALRIIKEFCEEFQNEIIALDPTILRSALHQVKRLEDLEDMSLVNTAIKNHCEYFITRDTKLLQMKKAGIKIKSPNALLKELKQ